jgi:hypothetical protein
MTINYTNIFHSKAVKNVPDLGLWYENKPSGNPVSEPLTLE